MVFLSGPCRPLLPCINMSVLLSEGCLAAPDPLSLPFQTPSSVLHMELWNPLGVPGISNSPAEKPHETTPLKTVLDPTCWIQIRAS